MMENYITPYVNEDKNDKQTAYIAQKILDTDNVQEVQKFVDLFNVNYAKRNVVRLLKLDEIQDSITDEILTRIQTNGSAIDDETLLSYLTAVQHISKESLNQLNGVENASSITLTQNNQVNINVNNTEMSLPRESRERITDAVQSILKKLNRDQIEQQNQLKNSNNE